MKSKHKILSGLDKLIDFDRHLLEINVSERAITHRLGLYYQDLFTHWDVDCEYNRHFDQPKDVEFDIKQLLYRMSKLFRKRQLNIARDLMEYFYPRESYYEELLNLEYQLRNPELEYDPEQDLYFFLLKLLNGQTMKKPVVPDIVVHKRNRRNNFIAIEAKKTSNRSIASREYDLLKLQALILDKRYSYKQGYFVDIPVLDDFENFRSFVFVPDPHEPRINLVLPNSS